MRDRATVYRVPHVQILDLIKYPKQSLVRANIGRTYLVGTFARQRVPLLILQKGIKLKYETIEDALDVLNKAKAFVSGKVINCKGDWSLRTSGAADYLKRQGFTITFGK